jgi:hypothetical protein
VPRLRRAVAGAVRDVGVDRIQLRAATVSDGERVRVRAPACYRSAATVGSRSTKTSVSYRAGSIASSRRSAAGRVRRAASLPGVPPTRNREFVGVPGISSVEGVPLYCENTQH